MGSDAVNAKITADSSGFRRAVQDAGVWLGHLNEKVREHKTEQIQEARITRFYANEIANLGIVSQGASQALGELAAGIAGGTVFAVAAGAAKGLLEIIKEISEAAHEQSEAFKKLTEDSKKFIEGQASALEDFLAALEGESAAQNVARKEALPLLAQETQRNKELAEVRARLAAINANVDENGMVADVVALNKATREEIDLQGKLAIIQAELAGVRKRVGGTAVGEGGAADKAAADARQKVQLAQSIADAQSRADQETAQNEINLAALKANQEIAQLTLTAQQKEALIAEVAAAQARADEAAEESGRNLLTIQVAQEQEARAEADALAEDAKRSKELGRAVMQMGQAAGEAFLGMLDGSKSVEESLLQLIAEMVKAALQMAALREIASGDFIGGAILGAGAVIAGGLGSIGGGGGGGGNTNLTVNNTFHGTQNASEVSLAMERSAMTVIRRMQARGRFT